MDLAEQLPETAKPDLKDFIKAKVQAVNDMRLPESVFSHLQSKHMMTTKQSKRYVIEYKKYIMCAIASRIAVTPSE